MTLRAALHWAILLALSGIFSGLLLLVQLPAALLLGPMIAAILFAVSGRKLSIHSWLFAFAQSMIGLLMARALTLSVLREIGLHWPIFITGVFSVILISFGLGWVLARLRVMPGSTALWGSSPGAASAMTLLCESFGADQRLVAFMLYLRVVLVALATSIVAHFATHGQHGGTLPHAIRADSPLWLTPLLAAAATLLGRYTRLPAGPLLLSMVFGMIGQDGFGFHFALPSWLLAPSYVLVGWTIGLRFTAEILRHVWRALPAVTLSSCTLIVVCALLAWPIAHLAHVDLLSAYLATSPGGADSVAIIAASNPVDMPFVMAMQVARFLMLMVVAPSIATLLARFLPTE